MNMPDRPPIWKPLPTKLRAHEAVYWLNRSFEAALLSLERLERLGMFRLEYLNEYKIRLELHPEKTKIVYCKDDNRKRNYPNEKFDFLGFTFRPRGSKSRYGKFFISFSPAISNQAAKAIRDTFRSWRLPQRSDKAIEDLSRMFNPIIRGWLQYYGRYYRTGLFPTLRELDRDLAQWAKRKYKKLRHHHRRARHWITRLSRRAPELFAHWQMGTRRGSVMGAV